MAAGDKYIKSSNASIGMQQLIRSLIKEDINGKPYFNSLHTFIPIPEPPFIIAFRGLSVVNSITGLDYDFGNGPSVESNTFQLIGDGLSPASGNVTITPDSTIDVYDGTTWRTTAFNVPYTLGEINSASIYKVRLRSGQSTGIKSGTLTISAPGATSHVITVNGEVTIPEPIINVTGDNLTFGNEYVGDTTAEQTYTVAASYLTSNLIITPPSGFEISLTSGSGFTSSAIIIVPSSGSVPLTTIYVVFKPTLVQSYSSSVSNASTGALTQNVSVTGVGLNEFIIADSGIFTLRDGDFIIPVYHSDGNFNVTSAGAVANRSITFLMLGAGGGGAGANAAASQGGGGGSAGQLLTGSFNAAIQNYPVSVGSAGAGGAFNTNGSNGGNTTFNALTANGGAGGVVGATSGGSGAGGAGSVSNGGIGSTNSITGVSVYYSGGGAAGRYAAGATAGTGVGGAGGGGNATGTPSTSSNGDGQSAAPYSGGGGAGASTSGIATFGSGIGGPGSVGLLMLRYKYPQPSGFIVATGGTETTVGDFKIYTFLSSGSLIVASAPAYASAEVLLVAGGGGGGGGVGGGGGAGGVIQTSIVLTVGTIPVIIGAGGTGGIATSRGSSGSNSSLGSLIAYGGGAGATGSGGAITSSASALYGGSGGGGGRKNNLGAPCVPAQGNFGGNSVDVGNLGAGGGGGAGAAGVNGTSTKNGNGGNGVSSSISGSSVTYGGGGGGGGLNIGANIGFGGTGGGGNGGNNSNGSNGTANTGGGGGGGTGNANNGGSGGSGIVIVKIRFQ